MSTAQSPKVREAADELGQYLRVLVDDVLQFLVAEQGMAKVDAFDVMALAGAHNRMIEDLANTRRRIEVRESSIAVRRELL